MDKRTEGREEKRINAQTGKGIPERWLLLAAADAAMPHLSLASNSIRVAGFGYSPSLPLFYLQYNGCRLQQTVPSLSRHKRGSNNDAVMGWVGTMGRRQTVGD